MNKLIAALIAGLFAVSAFAQSPAAPVTPAPASTAAAKTDAKTDAATTSAKTPAKKAKAKAKVKAKAKMPHEKAVEEKPAVKTDTSAAATTTTKTK